MAQNICSSISNYFQRILCKSKHQKREDEPIEEIVTTVHSNEENLHNTAQTQEIQEVIETDQHIPKKTYSEVLKEKPINNQQNEKKIPKTEQNRKEFNKDNPQNQSKNGHHSIRGGHKNRRNQNRKQESECDYNRGGYRGSRSNRSRGRNRRGAARGQHNNMNSSLGNRGYHRPRGNNEERPNRGSRGRGSRGGRGGRGGFVHGGINKSNSFRSSGVFSYSKAFCKTKDVNNNRGQRGNNGGQPVIFNYYIIHNVRQDGYPWGRSQLVPYRSTFN